MLKPWKQEKIIIREILRLTLGKSETANSRKIGKIGRKNRENDLVYDRFGSEI